MSIKLTFKGFDEMMERIEKAGGDIAATTEKAMREAAQVQQAELRSKMSSSGVTSRLISRMPEPRIEWSGNRCSVVVGYPVGSYDPKNLTDGYKAIFLNYGTPRVAPRNFVTPAKKAAAPAIKKAIQAALEEIMKELEA